MSPAAIEVRDERPLGFQVPSRSSVASGRGERDGHKLESARQLTAVQSFHIETHKQTDKQNYLQ